MPLSTENCQPQPDPEQRLESPIVSHLLVLLFSFKFQNFLFLQANDPPATSQGKPESLDEGSSCSRYHHPLQPGYRLQGHICPSPTQSPPSSPRAPPRTYISICHLKPSPFLTVPRLVNLPLHPSTLHSSFLSVPERARTQYFYICFSPRVILKILNDGNMQ